MAKKETGEKPICQNKRARINYFIDETYEAGIALVGTEVKALRDGRANLKDSYALIKEGELFLYDVHISPYSHGKPGEPQPRCASASCSCTGRKSSGSMASPRSGASP